MALISLVDRDRQWFKSNFGLDACETSRDVSFCGHAILGDGLLLVPDAREDVRFHDNPLVTGAPNIRFYAGYPLTVPNGNKMGTLCLIDTKPRDLDDEVIAFHRPARRLSVDEDHQRPQPVPGQPKGAVMPAVALDRKIGAHTRFLGTQLKVERDLAHPPVGRPINRAEGGDMLRTDRRCGV